MGKRGRPVYSEVRQNMVEILAKMNRAYGYDIYKAYKQIFPKVTLRVMYYHLRKGVDLGEFVVDKVEKTTGEYSWGPEAQKIFYRLGANAKPRGHELVEQYFTDSRSPSQETSQSS